MDGFKIEEVGDGTYNMYHNGRWIGWGTCTTPEGEQAMVDIEAKYLFGIDPYDGKISDNI